MLHAFRNLFLGHAPRWYKLTILAFLAINPLVLLLGGTQGATIAAWCIVLQFIFTLAMALKCYPLQPGGLLALEAVLLGLTHPDSVYQHTVTAFPILLLLIFMVAGIFFLKEMLVFCFTKLLLKVRSNLFLAFLFCGVSAVLAAFLDALTVLAVIITVAMGFYEVYHKVASGKAHHDPHDSAVDEHVGELHRSDLDAFRAVLRGLLMHAGAGTVIGGVMTPVGQPQNVLIAEQAGWSFAEFFWQVAPVTLPVFGVGIVTCLVVERLQWFGYGACLPDAVRNVLEAYDRQQQAQRTQRDVAIIVVQAITALILVFALALQLAEVGLIGLLVIVLATAFTGVTEEHRLGKAFEAALPFTALIVVFFVIVAQIHDQHLFEPVVGWALQESGPARAAIFYLASGLLSSVSDNVFVATIYITEVKAALLEGAITAPEFGRLAVAINTGTNIPSIATPNGQAALLFLLTSAVAPLIRLSYGRMVWMALPYTITLTLSGLWAVLYLL
ncbi:sodium/proton antiporter NhaB [Peristeroidobacter agariperforans]|uniref:sodium/proton antiporter NhaB n=1 Tax=Peristeroidobacter agariperforans TaxID=268404 RepID=UPI00101BDD1A|nr:sodium/proton antiporter NhaB [Peristeroidobacter agariperforans]